MNKFKVQKLMAEKDIRPDYLKAYKIKILNLCDAFFDNVKIEENEYINERNEDGTLPRETQEDFNYHYEELNSDCVAELCSDLCIGNEVFIDLKHSVFYDGDIQSIVYSRHGIWAYIKNKLDDVSFLVATISLMKNVSYYTKFGKWFNLRVKETLREYEFDFILEEILTNRVFIAMSFNKDMEEARRKIKKAVSDSGYNPIIIDEKEHSNSIVPEIFYEIKKSNFIIADFTGNRPSVYYEAGYAMGVGKKVIMTVSEKDFKEVHFDTRQVSHVVWENEDKLYEKLLNRIESTI